MFATFEDCEKYFIAVLWFDTRAIYLCHQKYKQLWEAIQDMSM